MAKKCSSDANRGQLTGNGRAVLKAIKQQRVRLNEEEERRKQAHHGDGGDGETVQPKKSKKKASEKAPETSSQTARSLETDSDEDRILVPKHKKRSSSSGQAACDSDEDRVPVSQHKKRSTGQAAWMHDDDAPLPIARSIISKAATPPTPPTHEPKAKKPKKRSESSRDLTHHHFPIMVSVHGIEAASSIHNDGKRFYMKYIAEEFGISKDRDDQEGLARTSQLYMKHLLRFRRNVADCIKDLLMKSSDRNDDPMHAAVLVSSYAPSPAPARSPLQLSPLPSFAHFAPRRVR